jgi:hypothetical protein
VIALDDPDQVVEDEWTVQRPRERGQAEEHERDRSDAGAGSQVFVFPEPPRPARGPGTGSNPLARAGKVRFSRDRRRPSQLAWAF